MVRLGGVGVRLAATGGRKLYDGLQHGVESGA